MSCENKNIQQQDNVTSVQESDFSGTLQNVRTIFEEAKKKDVTGTFLQKGVYKFVLTVPYTGDPISVPAQTKKILHNSELKRVRFEKIDVVPVSENEARVTFVAHIIDNPIWIPALIYGALGIAGLGGTWFVLDKLEALTAESLLPLASLVLVGIGLLQIFKK